MIMSVAWLLKGTVERGRERETAVAKSLLQNSSSLIFLEANILHPKALLKSFEDAFPFPKVVYVSSLKYGSFFAYIHTIHNIFFPTGFFYILSGSLDSEASILLPYLSVVLTDCLVNVSTFTWVSEMFLKKCHRISHAFLVVWKICMTLPPSMFNRK